MDGVALIGFGEAAIAFAAGLIRPLVVYDRKTDVSVSRRAKLDDYRRAGVSASLTNKEAIAQADLILSLVTADQALTAARETAWTVQSGALFCDLNSVAPATKRDAAAAIEAAGGRYVDVAVMAPVHPGGVATHLLMSGPHAAAGARALRAIGFSDVDEIRGPIGTATAVKLVRSIMVKGIEALSVECAGAAAAAGVLDEVVASLDRSWPGADWRRRLDYNLDRMMVHGLRRSAEMREAAAMIDGLGLEPTMTAGTIVAQQRLGARKLTPPASLVEKLGLLRPRNDEQSAA